MLFKIQSTTLLQIYCEFMIYSKVIFKSVKGPDGTYQGNLHAWMNGLTHSSTQPPQQAWQFKWYFSYEGMFKRKLNEKNTLALNQS